MLLNEGMNKADDLEKEQPSSIQTPKNDGPPCNFAPSPKNDSKKRLLLDEEKFEMAFLKCMVCRERYDYGDYVPKMLPCQHDVCLACLLEMFRVECEYRVKISNAFGTQGPTAVKIQCPACRESVVKSEAEIRGLPNDVTALQLSEFTRRSERCVVTFCARHPKSPMNFFCVRCKKQICAECTAREHSPLYGHEVIDSDEAMRQRGRELDGTLNRALAECNNLAETIIYVVIAINYLDCIKKESVHDIAVTFETFSAATSRDKADNLIDLSVREIERKCQTLREQLTALCKREAELKAAVNLLREARSCNDFDRIFVHHKIIGDILDKTLPLAALRSKEDLRYGLSFIPFDEEESFVEYVDGYRI